MLQHHHDHSKFANPFQAKWVLISVRVKFRCVAKPIILCNNTNPMPIIHKPDWNEKTSSLVVSLRFYKLFTREKLPAAGVI